MVPNKLLIRTIHAAKDAREQGFYNTAEALDDIVDSLFSLLKSGTPFQSDDLLTNKSEKNHII